MNELEIWEEVKAKLELRLCPTHHRNPVVNVTASGVEIRACCSEFEEALRGMMERVIKEASVAYAAREIRGVWNG
jgi:hypothetical protein